MAPQCKAPPVDVVVLLSMSMPMVASYGGAGYCWSLLAGPAMKASMKSSVWWATALELS